MRHTAGVLFEMAGDRAVLLDAAGAELITLNPLGSLVWQLLAEDLSREELANAVVETFPQVPEAQVRADLEALVAQLIEIGLVTRHAGG